LSALAIVLTFVGYVPYIRSIHAGKTKPHMFSWIIWGAATLIVFVAQLASGGGAGAWPIGVSGTITLYVAVLAYLKRGDSTVTRLDWGFLIAALSSLPLWYFTDDPLWAVIVLTTADTIGFGPTFRKAYYSPYEEDISFYGIFTVRNLISAAALEEYSVTTLLFPLVVAAACAVFIAMILIRRRGVAAS
jgi:hypothetical protein